MAAHEEQDEGIILLWGVVAVGGAGNLQLRRHETDHDRLTAAAGHLGPDVIGNPPRRDLIKPGARVVGHALARPLRGRGDQRLLNRVLRSAEVAEPPDDRAEHLRREVAQQVLGTDVQGRRHHSKSLGGPLITCRTSIPMLIGPPPGPGAADASAAIA